MAVINNRSTLATDPIRNFRFLAKFIPLDSTLNTGNGPKFDTTIGFTSISGLSVTTDSIPYREGGYNTTPHQIPGQTSFTPITMQRGVILGSHQNWDWMRMLFATVSGGSTNATLSTNFRCDIEIAVLAHPVAMQDLTSGNVTINNPDFVAMRYRAYNAWPTSVAYSDLNAGDNALLVEQMALVHEGLDLNWSNELTTTADLF